MGVLHGLTVYDVVDKNRCAICIKKLIQSCAMDPKKVTGSFACPQISRIENIETEIDVTFDIKGTQENKYESAAGSRKIECERSV